MKVEMIAGWKDPEEKIGDLDISRAHGRDIVSVQMDSEWMEKNSDLFLDPDIELYDGPQYPAEGKTIFGFPSDASPDRWGRRLLDRAERIHAGKERRDVHRLNDSDYLPGISDELRYGGIRFKDPETGRYLSDSVDKIPPITDLRMLEEAAHGYELSDRDEEALNILLSPGSSLGGARPKANVRDTDGSLWIAKFPSENDDSDIGAWEMTEHDLAGKCGIQVPEARMMRLSDRGTTFLTCRFDRENRKRIHLMSMMTALDMTDGNTDGAGYPDVAGILEQYSVKPEEDLQELWRRMVFNVLTSSCDDHLRNHGLILKEEGWRLSPAYDLNPVAGKKELSLNITDADNRRTVENVLSVAPLFRLADSDAADMLENMRKLIHENWRKTAYGYGIHEYEIENMKSAFALCE